MLKSNYFPVILLCFTIASAFGVIYCCCMCIVKVLCNVVYISFHYMLNDVMLVAWSWQGGSICPTEIGKL